MTDVPELTNFGSLFRYALELEEAAASFYDAAGALPSAPFAGVAREIADLHRERRREVERARQRFLNEVILEPITSLDGRLYAVDASPPGREDAVPRAVALEETSRRFYLDATEVARSMLAEAVRTFRKLGDGNGHFAVRMRGIGPG